MDRQIPSYHLEWRCSGRERATGTRRRTSKVENLIATAVRCLIICDHLFRLQTARFRVAHPCMHARPGPALLAHPWAAAHDRPSPGILYYILFKIIVSIIRFGHGALLPPFNAAIEETNMKEVYRPACYCIGDTDVL